MKKIILFTHSFPYEKVGEEFVDTELRMAQKLEVQITLLPCKRSSYIRENSLGRFILDNTLSEYSLLRKVSVFFKMLCSRFFWEMPWKNKKMFASFSFFYQAFKYLFGAFLVCDWIGKRKEYLAKNEVILYSYWTNHTPLGFALAKKKWKILSNIRCYSRAHGFDVYEEMVSVYLPYRNFTFLQMDGIFPCSKDGSMFMKQRYPKESFKIQSRYLGIEVLLPPNFLWPEKDSSIIRVVSCSSIINIKRVDLIARNLYAYAFTKNKKVEWHHFGDGEKKGEVKTFLDSILSKNFQVYLHGRVDNSTIQEFYQNNYVDLFVNLSLLEGIPVSIMEAIAMRIPVLATMVGGNREIVKEESGYLLPKDVKEEDFIEGMDFILKKGQTLRNSACALWADNFDASKNYVHFYTYL
ncbi:MAG: glycosyltransferase [Bacteroidales bacterium]